MGLVTATVKLSNPLINDLSPLNETALVDSGSTYLCIPQRIVHQLQLKELQQRDVILVDGSSRLVPYVGPVKIEFENRMCYTGAMAMGDQILLGAIPMEDMDLVIHPKLLKLTVNPDYPNIAHGLAKSCY